MAAVFLPNAESPNYFSTRPKIKPATRSPMFPAQAAGRSVAFVGMFPTRSGAAKLPRTHSQIVGESPRILAPIGRMEFLRGIAIAKQCRFACLPECKAAKAGQEAGGDAVAGCGQSVWRRAAR